MKCAECPVKNKCEDTVRPRYGNCCFGEWRDGECPMCNLKEECKEAYDERRNIAMESEEE